MLFSLARGTRGEFFTRDFQNQVNVISHQRLWDGGKLEELGTFCMNLISTIHWKEGKILEGNSVIMVRFQNRTVTSIVWHHMGPKWSWFSFHWMIQLSDITFRSLTNLMPITIMKFRNHFEKIRMRRSSIRVYNSQYNHHVEWFVATGLLFHRTEQTTD